MTPEETLNWLTQQHFDQCREERPIQDWIRKMKSQLPKQEQRNVSEQLGEPSYAERLLAHIEDFAKHCGWSKESGEGAFECVQRTSYAQGVEDGKLQRKQQQDAPVAWWNGNSKFATPKAKDWDRRTGGTTAFGCDIPLYTTPQQPSTIVRTWIGLTEEEMKLIDPDGYEDGLPQQIEAALKEKNCGTR
jgi:hypothetical protein